MPSSPSIPGSIAITSPATSVSPPAEPEPRRLVDLEADAVPEAEVEPVGEGLARRPRALGGMAGALDDLGRDVVERPAGDPGTRGGTRRFERLADDVAQRRDLVASPAPPTNVRVMSAQQPLSSSRGQRSISIGRSAGSGPEPGSCPPPEQRRDDHDARRRRRARLGARRTDRRTHRLGRERLAVVVQAAAVADRAPDQLSPAAMPASAARWARRMPASSAGVLTRRRASTVRLSTSMAMPSARSRSATATGRSAGTTAPPTPHLLSARTDRLELRLLARHALPDELEVAELVDREQLRIRQHLRDPLGLERARHHERAAVAGHERGAGRRSRAGPRAASPGTGPCRRRGGWSPWRAAYAPMSEPPRRAASLPPVELQAYTDADLALTEALETDPEVMRELGGPIEREKLPEIHRRRLGDPWWFKIVDGPAGTAVGTIGVWETRHGEETLHETGWMVLPAHQGRGIASAALTLLIERVRAEPGSRASTHSRPSPTRPRTRCAASSPSRCSGRPTSCTPAGRCTATTGRSTRPARTP